MPIASSWSDVLFLLIAAAIVFGVTALAVFLFGNRLARRNRWLAFISCAATVPALIAALAIFLVVTASQGRPPNDAPAMLFVALFTLAMLSCIISIPTSALLIAKATNKDGG